LVVFRVEDMNNSGVANIQSLSDHEAPSTTSGVLRVPVLARPAVRRVITWSVVGFFSGSAALGAFVSWMVLGFMPGAPASDIAGVTLLGVALVIFSISLPIVMFRRDRNRRHARRA
jgi:hypothetical protein